MYREDIEKDSIYRQNFNSAFRSYLDEEMKKAEHHRDGFMTKENLPIERERFREKYIRMLGYPLTEYENIKTEKIQVQSNFVTFSDGVSIYRMVITAYGNLPLYGILLLPETEGEKPFVLCLHGKEGTPELVTSIYENSGNYNHMAFRYAKRGCVVFCPQLYLWNSDIYGVPYDRDRLDASMRQLGGSMSALEVLLLKRVYDYFETMPYVNRDKMYVSGLSYGGMFAMLFGAAETRVKGVYSSCYFNDRYENGWVDMCYKNAANTFFDAEICALISPRKLFISVADEDPVFAVDTAKKEFERLKPLYETSGATENLQLEVFHGLHEFSLNDVGIDFLLGSEV